MSQKSKRTNKLIRFIIATNCVLTTLAVAGDNDDATVDCLSAGQVAVMQTQQCLSLGGAYIKPILLLEPLVMQSQQLALANKASAQYIIAEQYRLLGDGTQDIQQMLRWYRLAAQQVYIPALLSLGQIYEAGEVLDKDILRANDYYQQAFAASLGLVNKEATEVNNDDNAKRPYEYFTAIASLGELTTSESFAAPKQLENQMSELADAKQTLLLLATTKKVWQQELNAVTTGFAPTEFLRDSLSTANDELTQMDQRYQLAHQTFMQQQQDIAVLSHELTQRDANHFSAAGMVLLQMDLEQERTVLQQELLSVEAQESKQQQLLANKLSVPNDSLINDERMALSAEGNKRAALNRYLEEQEQNIQRRSATAKKRQKKLDFLEQRISKLKQTHQRKISADDAVILQRALQEMSHRYQGKVDYLSSNIEQQKTRVSRLSEQLDVADQVSKEKDQYIGAVKQELSKAASLVKQQSQLVTVQSRQLAEAIEQMKALHPQAASSASSSTQSLTSSLTTEQPVIQATGLTQTAVQQLEANSDLLAAEIVIKWPQFRQQGDVYIAQAPAGSLLNIVGAAYAPTSIKTFAINGELEVLDRNGLFMKTVAVSSEPVTVNLTMRSEDEQQVNVQLLIEPILTPPNNLLSQSETADVATPHIKDLDFGRYYALVIGNNDYSDTRLESLDTAVNDAEAVADVLQKKYGFEVDLLTNISRDELLQALENMRKKLTDKDNLLVYYAGHGIVDPENDQGYWIPVDGSSTSTSRWVSNATITDQIRAMSARNVLVVADSCYSGSLMRSSVLAIRSGLSPEKKVLRFKSDIAATTRVVLSSGGMQPVVDSIDNSQHSVFTGAMLKVLQDNVQLLDADSLATSVSHAVVMATQNNIKQVPRYAPLPRAGHEGGEFYFVPKEW